MELGFGMPPGGGAAAAFDPLSVFAGGDDGFYYDFTAAVADGKLFQDAAASSPVTTDAQSVGNADDYSPNDNDATQSTAAAKPTYDSDGFVTFDGGDYLDTGLAPTGAVTMVACFRNSAQLTPAQNLMAGISVANTRLGLGKVYNQIAGLYGAHNAIIIKGTTTMATGGDYVGTFRSDGSTNILRLNGAVEYSGAASGSPNPLSLYLGAYNNNGTAAELWDDRIYRALAVETDVDDATLLKLERAIGAGIVSF